MKSEFYTGIRTLRLSLLPLWLMVTVIAMGQGYQLELFVNDQAIAWNSSFADDEIGVLRVPEEGYVTVEFDGGKLELNLHDWQTFTYAHVIAVTYQQNAAGLYRFDATIRHNDQGWQNYADAFMIAGENVRNGVRVLHHPHDNEQPFTRSQHGVEARGWVCMEAKDNVEGAGGSRICLDLEALPQQYQLRYQLSPVMDVE